MRIQAYSILHCEKVIGYYVPKTGWQSFFIYYNRNDLIYFYSPKYSAITCHKIIHTLSCFNHLFQHFFRICNLQIEQIYTLYYNKNKKPTALRIICNFGHEPNSAETTLKWCRNIRDYYLDLHPRSIANIDWLNEVIMRFVFHLVDLLGAI